MALITDSYFIL